MKNYYFFVGSKVILKFHNRLQLYKKMKSYNKTCIFCNEIKIFENSENEQSLMFIPGFNEWLPEILHGSCRDQRYKILG